MNFRAIKVPAETVRKKSNQRIRSSYYEITSLGKNKERVKNSKKIANIVVLILEWNLNIKNWITEQRNEEISL